MDKAVLPSLVKVTITGLEASSSGSFPKLICWGFSDTEGASCEPISVRKALLKVSDP